MKQRAARCRVPGSDRVITLRASRLWDVVPDQIVTVNPRKQWRYGGHPYLSGEIESTFLCLHCGACEEVCQSFLPLVGAWDRLEALLSDAHGFPLDAVGTFIDAVDHDPDYRKMIHPGHVSRILPNLSPKPWQRPT